MPTPFPFLGNPLLDSIDCKDLPRKDRLQMQRQALHSLLRRTFAPYSSSEPILSHHPGGAPHLPQYPHLSISLSHSTTAVAALIVERPSQCGIDVEDIRPPALRLLPKFATPEEINQVQSAPYPLIAASLLWSAKESLYKLFRPSTANLIQSYRLQLPTAINPFVSATSTGELRFFVTLPEAIRAQEITVHIESRGESLLTWAIATP